MAIAPFNITCSERGVGCGGTREKEKLKGKREMSVLKGWEKGEMGGNYAAMLNTWQSKNG